MEKVLNTSDAFPKGIEFINRKRQVIRIVRRFWTADDKIEYLLICQGQSVQVGHDKVLQKINNNEWIENN